MKRLIKQLGMAAFLGASYATSAFAANADITAGSNAAQATGAPANLGVQIGKITNVLLYVIGAVAVIVLIIGGFRYVTSQGNSSNVAAAKDTILYAIVGLVVAILAYAIVNFVVKTL
jgi:TRAP-type C4-dicarboxylate transport system permease small subunit